MKRHTPLAMTTIALALSAGLTGCTEAPPTGGDRQPFRDGWEVAADQAFIHTGEDGSAQIFTVTIGGRESNDNFANRGDVIVNFDGPADRILIELRRFTTNVSEEAAKDDFDALSLWAFTSSLGQPQAQDAEDDCVASGWQNDCQVRVYFDGMTQLARAGADIRVTLPPDYRGRLNVVTQDNLEDEEYLNRGDVCVSNLFASADIETESGNVWVSLNPDAYPAPKCSPAQIDACENWTVEDETGAEVPAPWAPECDCIAVGGGEFGLLSIDNRENSASDIVVDVPAGLWTSINAQNKGDSQEVAGEHCEAIVTVPNAEVDETGNDFPWQAKYNANFPGAPAIKGAGFSIQASSNSCGPVAHTESPSEFVGEGNGDDQESSERGNIEICTDCIVQTCNELIP